MSWTVTNKDTPHGLPVLKNLVSGEEYSPWGKIKLADGSTKPAAVQARELANNGALDAESFLCLDQFCSLAERHRLS